MRRLKSMFDRWRRDHGRADAGDTLIEILVAITIMGLTVVAILGALMTSTSASVEHRSLTNLDGILKSFAESARYQIETQQSVGGSGPAFTNCSSIANYNVVGNPYPSSGPPGTVVSVLGLGFSSTSGATTSPALPGPPPFSYNATGGSSGAISTFTIPTTATPGTYTLYPFDGSHAAAVPFTVTNPGTTQVSPLPSTDELQTTASCPLAGNSNVQELDFELINAQSGSADTDQITVLIADLKALVATTTGVYSSTGGTSIIGQPVTYTATVNVPPPGSGTPSSSDKVSFMDGSSPASCASSPTFNGTTATCTVTYTSAGVHTITALFNGDSTYAGSSGTVTQTVSVVPTLTILTSSTNPVVVGQSTTLTATVSVPPPGTGPVPTGETVTFYDGTNVICSSPLTGLSQATCSASFSTAGTHTLSAVYSGDTTFASSTSTPNLNETVGKAGTSTTLSSSANPSTSGQPVTFTATVTPTAPGSGVPTGTVTFKDGTTTLGTGSLDATGTASFSSATLSDGAHSITASYAGDGNFTASSSTAFAQQVNHAAKPTSTAVTSDGNPATLGSSGKVSVTYTATVTVSGTGTPPSADSLTFFDGTTPISCKSSSKSFNGTSSTCIVQYSSTGSHSITAVFGGDTNFSGSTSPAYTETIQS